jgi:hypothetical protein
MPKKRGYNRDTPTNLVRDYKLFAIACEGSKTEPAYFNIFRHISSKIAVDIIEDIVDDEELLLKHPHKSAPRWVLDRAIKYIEKEGLSDEDDLWFVMDVDKWEIEQLREIAEYCDDKPNWHIVLSNPCFEVWLYFHKRESLVKSKAVSAQNFKTEISKLEKGGYHPHKFIPNLIEAISNAKAADSDKNYFFPKHKETKVYQLCEAIIKIIGKKQFDSFINKKLPLLHKIDTRNNKLHRKRL